jgi:Holliday junction resolvasome RuvABC endonuclease subunit
VIVCGIDPSIRSTGIVFYDTETNKLYATCVKQEQTSGFLPLFSLALLIGRYIKKYNPKVIAIEQPIFYKGRVQGAMRTFYFHALLRGVIHQNHAKSIISEYWPTAWKKRFTGNGHSTKGLVVWTALKDYGWKFFNSDIADAFGIMQVALTEYRSARASTNCKKKPQASKKHSKRTTGA